MKRIIPIVILAALLLSGCSSWLDSSYSSVQPHEEQTGQVDTENVSVSDYAGLYDTLCSMVENGTESGIISVARYDQKLVEEDMKTAVSAVMTTDPIAAYAVEEIRYELGANAGQPAVAVNITYLHSRSEIRKIQKVTDQTQMKQALAETLDNCNFSIVLYVEAFEEMDFDQWVSDYAASNPDLVMEVPAVTIGIYPEEGQARVVEVKFTYQNSRESLRLMQAKVSTLFSAAAIYAGDEETEGTEVERYFKLYSFLMGLFQSYELETSITPAYSLLQHGVGDSKAFATVYAAMCEKVGLECIVVTGTRAGEPWYWNMVCSEGVYYHVDLWESNLQNDFLTRTDAEMSGYVWDYSAYPEGGAAPKTEE